MRATFLAISSPTSFNRGEMGGQESEPCSMQIMFAKSRLPTHLPLLQVLRDRKTFTCSWKQKFKKQSCEWMLNYPFGNTCSIAEYAGMGYGALKMNPIPPFLQKHA